MNSSVQRSYRKNLKTKSLIYIDGKQQEVTVKNISLTGLLVEIPPNEKLQTDIQTLFSKLLSAHSLDFYLPELRLAGDVNIVRVDMEGNAIVLALEFKQLVYDVDSLPCRRKAYRKVVSVAGRVLLNGETYNFKTVNISVSGVMIHLQEIVAAEINCVTVIEFKALNLKGKAKVIWTDTVSEEGTLIGLQYVSMKKMFSSEESQEQEEH